MTILSEALGLMKEGLDNPARSIIDEKGMMLALYQALSLYNQQLTSSDHLILGLHFDPQVPVTRDMLLTSEAGFSQAGYVERQVDVVNDRWKKVDIVDIDQLDAQEDAGNYAIAFYGSGPTAAARLSWDPAMEQFNQLRIWHSPNSIYPTTMNDELNFPPNFTQMLANKAIMLIFPKLIRRATKANDDSYVSYLQAWRDTNGPFLSEFEEQFMFYRTETKDSGSGVNLAFGAHRRGGLGRRL